MMSISSLLSKVGRFIRATGKTNKDETITGRVDMASETHIYGWVLDTADASRAIELEVVFNDVVIATGKPHIVREDVVSAGYNRLLSGFRLDLPIDHQFVEGDYVQIRDGQSKQPILGSPVKIQINPAIGCFRSRINSLRPESVARFKRRHCNNGVGISIVMPIYNTREDWLHQAITSVVDQWHQNWELICIDDCSTEKHIGLILEAYAAADDRIVFLTTEKNSGISVATNLGIANAKYEFIAFMDHDDYLEPTALHIMSQACQIAGVDLVYSDEIITGEDINHFLEFRARPSFSYDYYMSHPYFVHFIMCRKSIADSIGGLNEKLAVSQDVDFVLRILEKADKVAHVPHFVYRWRTHSTSTGHLKKNVVRYNTCSALSQSLSRIYPGCHVIPGHTFNTYRVSWPYAGGKTLIVIPTKNAFTYIKKAIESIEFYTLKEDYELVVVDHESDDPECQNYLTNLAETHGVSSYCGSFNFSRMNNIAARDYGKNCEYILFLNNDVEIICADWLDRLRSIAARSDVGAVGPMLVYDNNLVQHGGVIVGFNQAAEHVLKLAPAYNGRVRNPGYNATLTATRDFSAVTAACLMTRRKVFEEVNGFDEELDVGFNDTDLCLRIRSRGYKIIYDGDLVVRHHESVTRNTAVQLLKHPENTKRFKTRWRKLICDGDPLYSPMLAIDGSDHVIRQDRPNAGQLKPRVTKVGLKNYAIM